MKFSVVNDEGVTVMTTEQYSCIPPQEHLMSMSKAGYKFKVDGKVISVKKIKEMLSLKENGGNI